MKHPEETIQSQYAASPNFLKLVEGMNQRIDPSKDIQLFYDEIFNIMTARGWGLDNWGRILGISRYMDVNSDEPFSFLGSELQGFDQGPFRSPKALTNLHAFADHAYRELLLYKAAANISPSDAATINRLLGMLYPHQKAYVLEDGIMTIRFVFEFHLKPYQHSIFRSYGMLTRGAGVGYKWISVEPEETFGFAGSNLQTFNNGTFNGGLNNAFSL